MRFWAPRTGAQVRADGAGWGPVLEVAGLAVTFGARRRTGVVRSVSFGVGAGEVVTLVGEPGSGLAAAAGAVLGVLPLGGRVTGGSIAVLGRSVVGARGRRLGEVQALVAGVTLQDSTVELAPTVRLLVVDGISGVLDANRRRQALDQIERVAAQRGLAVLLTTRDGEEAVARADRVLVLSGGEVAQELPGRRVRPASSPAYPTSPAVGVPVVSSRL